MKSTPICLAAVAVGLAGFAAPVSAEAAPPEAVVQAQQAAKVTVKVSVPKGGEALTYTNEQGESVTVGAGSVAMVPMTATNVSFPLGTVITVTVKQFGAKPIVQTYRVIEAAELAELTPAAVNQKSTAFSIFKDGLAPEEWERGNVPTLGQLLDDAENGIVNPVNAGQGEPEATETPETPEKPTTPSKPKPTPKPATDMN
ncbi:hypothetical protein [Sulfuriroseicoccus oceanibius]|uniref:Uncharacterized protein n=1 Tax=Sulfuriroseicoccus oceanibius TaxID=2707525 RepID=A0A6B3L1S5_9BACT|nr:hypothetical protein [Sulfuriroseicoccus oceanibius]QQL44320.1 hypothetical protein G3M56_010535 [Sulfuriroseicoccus oceanibius]